MDEWIRIRGARQHNLRNIDVDIPRDQFTAVSGLSGSGKSSLVFDTLYAEGQRCYVESLSTYARQFLERLPKPDVDWIDGISPAIAIQQRNAVTSGRSTVGTVTEINDYLRVLFARVGKVVCPDCHETVTRETPDSIWRKMRQTWPDAPVLIGYPQEISNGGDWAESLLAQGFQRAVVKGEVVRLEEAAAGEGRKPGKGERIEVVVDRLKLASGARSRAVEAVELALRQSGGWLVVRGHEDGEVREFASQLICNGCGRVFAEPTPQLFSFNNPQGACPACKGFGNKLEFDEARIVPDPDLAIRDGAVKPWSTQSFARERSALYRYCTRHKIPLDLPYAKLTRKQQQLVIEGTDRGYVGIIPWLEQMRTEMKKAHHRFFTRRYMGDTLCRACGGTRLRPEALAVTVAGMNLGQIGQLAVGEAYRRLQTLRLPKVGQAVAGEVLDEGVSRLRFLDRVGLGYLTLDRLTRTLSGGEAQRIHLANSLGSRLVDTLYVLDEPTCGLHAADCERLVDTLLDLVAGGNTVVVVEHDLDVLRRAEYFIELGPGAGREGGHVVYQGPLAALLDHEDTLTAAYLRGERGHVRRHRRPVASGGPQLRVKGARQHNLRELDVRIPLQRFVALTGVSGSGKSSLMNGCLHAGLTGHATGGTGRTAPFTAIQGGHAIDKVVRVDQTPIGKTSRSNPATYLQILAPIRDLLAATPDALARGYTGSRFSFNTAGGRCPACQGMGFHRVEMQFMADIEVPCEDCGGKRFNAQTLEIKYRGLNIAEILAMTVAEALKFFAGTPAVSEKLWLLKKVGLGYLTLGQPAPTLSGGESQRLKVARELVMPSGKRNLYLLDEPTTGLHADDVQALVAVLHELVEQEHTVLVIEHNLDLVAQADWVIDLGPGGGDDGGRLVAQGTPEDVASESASLTGQYLAAVLPATSGLNERLG